MEASYSTNVLDGVLEHLFVSDELRQSKVELGVLGNTVPHAIPLNNLVDLVHDLFGHTVHFRIHQHISHACRGAGDTGWKLKWLIDQETKENLVGCGCVLSLREGLLPWPVIRIILTTSWNVASGYLRFPHRLHVRLIFVCVGSMSLFKSVNGESNQEI